MLRDILLRDQFHKENQSNRLTPVLMSSSRRDQRLSRRECLRVSRLRQTLTWWLTHPRLLSSIPTSHKPRRTPSWFTLTNLFPDRLDNLDSKTFCTKKPNHPTDHQARSKVRDHGLDLGPCQGQTRMRTSLLVPEGNCWAHSRGRQMQVPTTSQEWMTPRSICPMRTQGSNTQFKDPTHPSMATSSSLSYHLDPRLDHNHNRTTIDQ